jgi:hypothetical protein
MNYMDSLRKLLCDWLKKFVCDFKASHHLCVSVCAWFVCCVLSECSAECEVQYSLSAFLS